MDKLQNMYADYFGGEKVGLIDLSQETFYSAFGPRSGCDIRTKFVYSLRGLDSIQSDILEVSDPGQ